MPVKPAHLKPAHSSHTPSRSSLLSNTTHPRSPSTPLTPPLRLHLRTALSSPPITPDRLGPVPEYPYPWIWRCHVCYTTYRLGVTRRCLEDGHYFCSLPTSPPPTPVSPTHGHSKKRRRKQVRGCRAEFDYAGWSVYNDWRREVQILKAEDQGKEVVTKMRKDCWNDCDFPSECLVDTKANSILGVSSPLSGSGPSIAENSSKDFEDSEGDSATLVDLAMAIDDAWKDLVTDEIWGDEDEELALEQSRKEKSIQKIQQLTGIMLTTDIPMVVPTEMPESPPSSPLKMHISVDEQDPGYEIVWESETQEQGEKPGERRGSGDSIDPQLHELMEARSLFLRKFDGEYDEFGDAEL